MNENPNLTNTPPSSSSKTTSEKSKRLPTKLVLAAIAAVVLLVIIFAAWFVVSINSAKNPSDSQQILVAVAPNSSLKQVGNLLKDKGLINDPNLFGLYAKFGPSHGQLQPGLYLLRPNMSLAVITDTIGLGKTSTRKVTFQEGLTVAEDAVKWQKAGLGTSADFLTASKLPYTQAFLAHKPATTGLDGYLFPATYDILITSSPQEQISIMLDTFASQVLPKLPADIANSTKLNELITLASIVEKEANTTADRKLVASVFYNRLERGMKLESDVTVNYATGKTQTLPADLKTVSPYNTYIISGLPIGPICSPGLDAILATAFPDKSDYLFFLADQKGTVHFAKTLQEHEQNIVRYLN